ncbi:MAG: sensor domain-containing diguanylate cyclase [Butyrivibrio sp.]|nr:sensor domain-containing diguanylate cyclase [Butyrivibrio sp.]
MGSENSTYERLKTIAVSCVNPCAIMKVTRNADKSLGEIRIFAANDRFSLTGEPIEGELYTKFIPEEPEFNDMCYKAAFEGKRFHTYVDATRMVGGWSENLILPLVSDEENIGYCQFIYEVTSDMEPGKFSAVNPVIAGIILKSCLTLRNGIDFEANLDTVMEDIREFTDALSVSLVMLNNEKKKAKIQSQSVRSGAIAAEQLITMVPYEIAESWERLVGESDCFIIRDKGDLDKAEEFAPEWAKLLKAEDAQSLCLVPLHQKTETLGYLLATNFDISRVNAIKETMEILGLFLSSEIANHMFLKRLEWLTSIDMLTGVRNRASMNRVVDELAARTKYSKIPFGVAFCTMPGLKILNDTDGHDAGNEALQKAGSVLRDVFDETEVFRSAGEEFAIVVEDITSSDFEKKIELLRKLGSDPDSVYFAIGFTADEKSGDVRKALREAYRQMADEKMTFYEQYPEKAV